MKYRVNCHPALGGLTDHNTEYKGRLYGPEIELFTMKGRKLCQVPDSVFERTPVSPELGSAQLEISGGPFDALADMHKFIRSKTAEIIESLPEEVSLIPLAYAGSSYDSGAVCTLTDTYLRREASQRYAVLRNLFGDRFVQKAARTGSDQLNVGGIDEEDAFAVFRLLRSYLPIFAAFSGASPFNTFGSLYVSNSPINPGRTTTISSYRLFEYKNAISAIEGKKIDFKKLIPPAFESLAHYLTDLESLSYPHPNTMYYFIRPMPHRGVAAEIRIMDKQPSNSETMALFALAKGLVNSGIERNVSDCELGEEIEEAAITGIYNVRLFYDILQTASENLPAEERQYLTPLERRIIHGNVADKIVTIASEYGMDTVFSLMVKSLYEDVAFT